MASSPCRAACSQDSGKESTKATTTSTIPDCMPGTPARWFFPLHVLQGNNPSVKTGTDLEKELYYRQQAASFIHELGSKLQLSHLVMNVAMVYMHRFYVFHPFRRFPRNDMAAACIFLAAKVEEMPRKLEYIVKVSFALQHRDEPPLDVKSNRYNEEAQRIITYENVLLQTLGFDLTVTVPNQFVVKCIQMVKAPKELAQAAYHFTNDCLHLTTLCLRYRPAVVACASIFLACSWAKWEIPTSHEGKPWFYYVDPEVTKEILEALAEEIVNVYQKCPERLKIKRYMATKREDPGGAGTSTSEGGVTDETHESALYNSVLNSRAPVTIGHSSKIKAELEPVDAQKPNVTDAPTYPKPVPSASQTASQESAEKKHKVETAKVDLKSYIDRMKERRPEQQSKTAPDQPIAPTRKSFMPDVSLAAKEMEEIKRRERYEERHSRGGQSQDAQRQSGIANRHEQRKGEHSRHHADADISVGGSKKRQHDADGNGDELSRKIPRSTADSFSRHAKEAPKGSSISGESKAGAAQGARSTAGANGMQLEEEREKSYKKPEGDAADHSQAQSTSQKVADEKSESRPSSGIGFAGMPDDDTLRQATQKAQMLKLQKLERLKSMDMKLAAGGSKEGRDKSTKRDSSGNSRPPLPSSSPPPLPPVPPPPPPT